MPRAEATEIEAAVKKVAQSICPGVICQASFDLTSQTDGGFDVEKEGRQIKQTPLKTRLHLALSGVVHLGSGSTLCGDFSVATVIYEFLFGI